MDKFSLEAQLKKLKEHTPPQYQKATYIPESWNELRKQHYQTWLQSQELHK